ncbi:UNKNOWN [Stylonychia lemnae]|uniref:Uncharacterized protein n=1 Tax=Stylonychia lemnae TaxID=5949 RepID=A0A078AZK1_STYLE|nr:UNKNOWN [Stylonychia lemnae]|eukprot:CDW87594.1 UNKNOWN [Stylonychia lemnae]
MNPKISGLVGVVGGTNNDYELMNDDVQFMVRNRANFNRSVLEPSYRKNGNSFGKRKASKGFLNLDKLSSQYNKSNQDSLNLRNIVGYPSPREKYILDKQGQKSKNFFLSDIKEQSDNTSTLQDRECNLSVSMRFDKKSELLTQGSIMGVSDFPKGIKEKSILSIARLSDHSPKELMKENNGKHHRALTDLEKIDRRLFANYEYPATDFSNTQYLISNGQKDKSSKQQRLSSQKQQNCIQIENFRSQNFQNKGYLMKLKQRNMIFQNFNIEFENSQSDNYNKTRYQDLHLGNFKDYNDLNLSLLMAQNNSPYMQQQSVTPESVHNRISHQGLDREIFLKKRESGQNSIKLEHEVKLFPDINEKSQILNINKLQQS